VCHLQKETTQYVSLAEWLTHFEAGVLRLNEQGLGSLPDRDHWQRPFWESRMDELLAPIADEPRRYVLFFLFRGQMIMIDILFEPVSYVAV